MGTWDAGIFGDDEAQDAREAYLEILASGVDGTKATDRFLKEWKSALKDSDDGPVIWFALAATQWSLGRLEDRVRDRAIEIIDEESSLDRWKEAGARQLAKRRKTLSDLRDKLLAPQPARKAIKVQSPVKPLQSGAKIKPAELRKQLKALYCTLEPSRGGALTSVVCRGGMTDALLSALLICVDTLESLHIESSPALTDAGLRTIGELVNLKRLAIRNLALKDSQLANFQRLAKLESLEVRGRDITDRSGELLTSWPAIRKLDLSGTSIGDATFAVVGGLARIGELWARSTKVTDKGLAKLAGHAGLKQLYLAGNAVSDRGATKLATLPNIISLDLAETEISDKTIAALSTRSSIRSLDVQGTRVTDGCVDAILKLSRLCYLNVEQTKISKDGLSRLHAGLPLLGNQEHIRAMYRDMRA